MEAVKADLALDLKGLLCPIPVVKMAQAVKTVPLAGIIEATATDPGVMADIPAWGRTTGHKLLSMERQEKLITFVVQRVK